MKVEDFNLLATCIMAVAVLGLIVPSRSHEQTEDNEANSPRNEKDSGQRSVLVGRCMVICVCACCHIRYIFIAVKHYFKVA